MRGERLMAGTGPNSNPAGRAHDRNCFEVMVKGITLLAFVFGGGVVVGGLVF
jgi:hypothetical protein